MFDDDERSEELRKKKRLTKFWVQDGSASDISSLSLSDECEDLKRKRDEDKFAKRVEIARKKFERRKSDEKR